MKKTRVFLGFVAFQLQVICLAENSMSLVLVLFSHGMLLARFSLFQLFIPSHGLQRGFVRKSLTWVLCHAVVLREVDCIRREVRMDT